MPKLKKTKLETTENNSKNPPRSLPDFINFPTRCQPKRSTIVQFVGFPACPHARRVDPFFIVVQRVKKNTGQCTRMSVLGSACWSTQGL